MTTAEVAVAGVAMITCCQPNTPKTTGSGYLVAPGIVLTAGHVVAYGAPDIEVSVSFLGDGGATYAAAVLASGGGPDEPDLALLELTGTGPELVRSVRFGEVARGTTGRVAGCVAVGFPVWKRNDQSAQLEGSIATAANLGVTTTGPLELRTDITPRDRSTPSKSAWAGMSGAVVFARGPDGGPVALGVVTTHHLPEGNSTVTVTPLTSLPDKEVWHRHLDIGTLTRFPTTMPAVPRFEAGQDELPLPSFTDRETDVATVDELLSYATTAAGTVVNIYGMAGVGKSELAKHVAYQQKTRFPLRLYLDLGEDEARKSREDVVTTLLERLPASRGEQPPRSAAERVRRVRERLGLAPSLLVLDNADGADQLTGLTPPAGSAVLVTSRAQLADDPVELFHHLDPLEVEHGVELFTTLSGRQRADTDPDAARRIVAQVGGLPLGVRIAASTAVSSLWRDLPLSALANEYATADDDLYKRMLRVFDVSYDGLAPEVATFFGRIGLLPGIDFGLPLAAHAAETEPVKAQAMLRELVVQELVSITSTEPRYRLHPLVRRYARVRARAADTSAERTVPTRVVGWYADRVATLMSAEGAHEQPPEEALDWIAAEADNLRAAWRAGHEVEAWDELTTLMNNVYGLLAYRGRWSDMVEAQRIGLAAARMTGDRRALIGRLIHLAEAMRITGTVAETQPLYEEATAIAHDLDDPGVTGWVLTHHGDMLCDLGNPLGAIDDHYRRARAIYEQQQDAEAINWLTAHVTDAHRQAKRLDNAIDEAKREVAAARERGDLAGVVWSQEHLALALTDAGRFTEARAALAEAIEYHETRKDRIGLATALLRTARINAADNHRDEARAQLTRARAQALAVDTKHPLITDIDAELSTVDS